MNISKQNYEAFFLDYHEGNLGEELKKEVLAFVASNPELKEEFESFELISLTGNPVVFSGKEQLKKNIITEFNYKTWLVAFAENDLDHASRKLVENFLQTNPGYKRELEILQAAKLTPDLSITFKSKSSLKKGGLVIPLWVRIAAAACLLIGLVSFWMYRQQQAPELVHHSPQHPVAAPLKEKIEIKDLKNPVAVKENLIESKKSSSVQIKTALKKKIEKPAEQNLAVKDSSPSIQKAENVNQSQDNYPLANNTQPHTTFVINSSQGSDQPQTTVIVNAADNSEKTPAKKLVVLDDNDLADLGLIEKTIPVQNNSLLADAVNGVGKVFNVNAHYNKSQGTMQSKLTETLALGPVAITRTVR